MNTQTWLTRNEAADRLQVAPVTIDTYIRAGKLKATAIGGEARITAASVESLRLQNEHPKKITLRENVRTIALLIGVLAAILIFVGLLFRGVFW